MTIKDEALAVLDTGRGLFLPEDENLRETGDWGQFTLWQQGNTHTNRIHVINLLGYQIVSPFRLT